MTEEGSTRLDDFIHGPSNVSCNGQEATVLEKKICNIYGRAIVAAGRAEWDFRIDFESFGGIIIGLWRHDLRNKNDLSNLPLDKPFVKSENGYGYTTKNGQVTTAGNRRKFGKRFRKGQICTVHLDLQSRELSYSIDGEKIGVAFDNLPKGAYRLAVKLQFKEQKVSITRFWTSLKDGGIPDVLKTDNGIENYDKTATPVGANQDKTNEDFPNPKEENSENDNNSDNNNTVDPQYGRDFSVSDPPPVVTNPNDINNGYPTDESDSGDKEDKEETIEPLIEEDEEEVEEDDEEDEYKSKIEENTRHERSVSIHEIKKEIQHQRKRSGSVGYTDSLDEKSQSNSSSDEDKTIDIIGGRNRSTSQTSSNNSNQQKQKPPERIEISKKDDETIDSFINYGSNLNCKEGKVVTCNRSQENIRHSAFGAQVISSGRMEWMLKIDKGHSIRIGVSGVSNTTNEDFTSSKYGYGYGDDGNIYHNNSCLEYHDGFKVGDIVGVFLDMNRGTLKFTINENDHGDAFEELEKDEENGIYGFKLAVSLQHRPHSVSLLKSTRWETKQLSPRPNTNKSMHKKRPSWGSTPKEITPQPNGPISPRNILKPKKPKSPTKNNNKSKSPKKSDSTKSKNTKSNSKNSNNKSKNTKNKGKTSKNKSKTDTKSKNKSNNNKGKKNTNSSTKKPKTPKIKTDRNNKSKNGKNSINIRKKSPSPRPKSKLNTPDRSMKRKSSSRKINWVEKKSMKETFKVCGNRIVKEGVTCRSKNNIQDGNSAFGTLEIKDNMRVVWDIKILGDSVALGIIQASNKSLSNQKSKYSKLLNGFFSNDRMGFGYYGKEGGTMKGGKYTKYGESFKSSDIISVSLNSHSHTLSFSKNGKDLGVAYKNIPTGTYRLAVSLPKKSHKVTIKKVTVWEKK